MATTNRIETVPVRMSTVVTNPRQTEDRGFGARVHMGINQAASTVVNAASLAGSFLPGAPIVSAAISQVANLGGAPGSTVSPSVLGGGIAGTAYSTALAAGPSGLIGSSVASAS